MTKFNPKEILLRRLQTRADDAKSDLDAWKERLEASPANSLEWSGVAFTSAATIQVCTDIVTALTEKLATDPDALQKIANYAMDTVKRGARNPPSSTSPTSNLMESLITSEWAKALESVESILYAVQEKKRTDPLPVSYTVHYRNRGQMTPEDTRSGWVIDTTFGNGNTSALARLFDSKKDAVQIAEELARDNKDKFDIHTRVHVLKKGETQS